MMKNIFLIILIYAFITIDTSKAQTNKLYYNYEITNNVKSVYIKKMCSCGGEMKPTGQCYTSYPPKYPHQCTKCQVIIIYSKPYPSMEFTEDK